MTDILYIDFKNKKLISKKTIGEDEEMPDQVNFEKLDFFTELIQEGMVSVMVNTQAEGLNIPIDIQHGPVSTINWSLKFNVPDFAYDHDGVRGTLSFNKRLHFTDLPWTSVFSIESKVNDKSKKWGESFPKQVMFPGAEQETQKDDEK